MRGSSQKDISVFEFGGDEDMVESVSSEIVKKFTSTNPSTKNSDLTKDAFLQVFRRGHNVQQSGINDASSDDGKSNNCVSYGIGSSEKEFSVEEETPQFGQQSGINNVVCVDFVESSDDGKCNNCASYAIGSSEKDFSVEEETPQFGDILVSNSMTSDDVSHISQDNFETGNLIPGCLRVDSLAIECLSPGVPCVGSTQLNSTLLELPSDRKHVDVVSDDDESLKAGSPSISSSDCAETEGAIERPTSDYCTGYVGMEMEIDTEVTVSPDYVTYGHRYFTQCQLTFYSDYIKLEDSNACGDYEPYSYEWAVDDVIHIRCQWKESVEVASVALLLRRTTPVGVENLHASSGIVKLAFAVEDPQWLEKQQKITSLASRYKAIWNVRLDDEIANEVDDFMGQTGIFVLKHFFSNDINSSFDEPSEEVVYPKGDPDAVSISKRDVKLLEPETFVNDTIIDFYIKYLKNEIRTEDKHRFHFFNSFFFRKLADLDKDPGSALEGRAAFQRVRKWTRKVNIFEKDYIFVPVNFNLHWSLIVICHPGEVALFKDHEIDKAPKVPCILHMDSIKGNHQGLKNLVQCYLWEEWKERHEESSEDVQLKFKNLRFVPLELPQQENLYDCGLFLLHYVELFLEEAPVNFSPFKISKFSNFLNMDWFPPTEASHKRFTLRKLICELFDEHSEETPPANGINLHHSSQIPENDTEIEPGVELLSEQCTLPKKTSLGNSLCSTVNRGIEMQLLAISSPDGVQYDKQTRVVLQKLFEQGPTATSCHDERYERFHQNTPSQKSDCTLSPIEEDLETGEQFISSPSDRGGYPLPDGIACVTSYSAKDVAVLERSKENSDDDSSSELLGYESPHSAEIGVDGHPLPLQSRDVMSFNEHKETENLRNLRSVSPEICEAAASGSSERPETGIVDDSEESDSQEVDAIGESKESGESVSSRQETLPASSRQDIESTENDDCTGDGVQLISVVSETRLKKQVNKRRKLMVPEGERRRTRRVGRECLP
ncbi:putative ubiquitin-like-specific protease 2B [Tasmannia lanceolata]|uniref:putative ubiquitin-like-specific protease 2B n=1 Tax=Tasmannia lanceolata TaxID=3420 RepID=UPI0040643ADE